VLLHLARGSGLAGLTGIAPRRGQVVRPLLGMRRAALRTALDAEGIRYRTDASNADQRFARNRSRADLVPLLESLHPGAAEAVGRTARLVAADDAALDELAAACLAARREPGGWLAWATPPPVAIARRVLRLAIGDPFPPAERIDALLSAAARDAGGRTIQLGAGRRAVIRRHRLRIEDDR
jgi:tRNA(Ile)-lysidine synthase